MSSLAKAACMLFAQALPASTIIPMRRETLLIMLRVIVSAGLLGWIIVRVDLVQLSNSVTTTNLLPLAWDHLPRVVSVGVIGLGLCGVIILVLIFSRPSVEAGIAQLSFLPGRQVLDNAVKSISALDTSTILGALLVSATHSALIIFIHFLVGRANAVDVSLLTFAVITPIVTTSLLLPSIQGLGVREGLYTLLLSQFGVPESVGLLVGLGIYLQKLVTGMIGGVWHLIRSTRSLVLQRDG